jgi:hypothetical protein
MRFETQRRAGGRRWTGALVGKGELMGGVVWWWWWYLCMVGVVCLCVVAVVCVGVSRYVGMLFFGFVGVPDGGIESIALAHRSHRTVDTTL